MDLNDLLTISLYVQKYWLSIISAHTFFAKYQYWYNRDLFSIYCYWLQAIFLEGIFNNLAHCYFLQFYSAIQLELLNKIVEWTAWCCTSKIANRIAQQLAQMIWKTTSTNSYTRQIIGRKWFAFGMKLIYIWQCKFAYFQP